MKNSRILVIGLGQIGYSNAEYMKSIGLEVDGYDISSKAIERALSNKVINRVASSFQDYDYYLICISTHAPEDMFVPFLDGLYEIANRLKQEGKPGALVGIDSTVTSGTSQALKRVLQHNLHVAHVPHRFFGEEKDDHGVRQERVLGGCEPCCVEAAVQFYRGILQIPVHVVDNIETAELCKIVENSYRFVEIAFAEELKMFCDRAGTDFRSLRAAINTKWNVKILEPRTGVGGHCLPKDSQMFLEVSKNFVKSSIIEAAKNVDNQYRNHITRRAEQPQLEQTITAVNEIA